jgi:hypothetical protein
MFKEFEEVMRFSGINIRISDGFLSLYHILSFPFPGHSLDFPFS